MNTNTTKKSSGALQWVLLLLVLVMAGALGWMFMQVNELQTSIASQPTVEEEVEAEEGLSIELELTENGIQANITNTGVESLTIAQVFVDEAYWNFSISPAAEVPGAGSATIDIPYPWVEGEGHEIVLVTSTGETYDAATD